jgi:hypothetical protein
VSELVLERKFWSTGDLSLTLRHKDLVDQIDVAPLNLSGGETIGVYQNIGNGYQNDLSLNLMFPFSRLGLNGGTLKATLTWTDTKVTDPVTGSRRPITGQPGFVGEVHFAEDLPQWKLNVGADAAFNGPDRIYTPFGDQTQGAWGQFSVYAEYRPNSEWSIRGTAGSLPGLRLHQVIDTYAGLKDASPLLYRDTQDLGVPAYVNLQIRRSFF